MNDEALLSQVIYPIIFDKHPLEAIDRVTAMLRRDLSSEERARLSNLLRSKTFDVNHPIINLHNPICDKKDLEIYLEALAREI